MRRGLIMMLLWLPGVSGWRFRVGVSWVTGINH
jgi:hypothetical protein